MSSPLAPCGSLSSADLGGNRMPRCYVRWCVNCQSRTRPASLAQIHCPQSCVDVTSEAVPMTGINCWELVGEGGGTRRTGSGVYTQILARGNQLDTGIWGCPSRLLDAGGTHLRLGLSLCIRQKPTSGGGQPNIPGGIRFRRTVHWAHVPVDSWSLFQCYMYLPVLLLNNTQSLCASNIH